MPQSEHVGPTALDAERSKLLADYDTAVKQGADDPIKTAHGVSCEAHFRTFLEQFLPKKYGVTKGYIITPNLDYAGPLEEWDVIIYDSQESPVLFVRRTKEESLSAGERGIPVEFVRGVIEVKATFNKAMATQVTRKLLKLRSFQATKPPYPGARPSSLPSEFRAAAVFFETKVSDAKEYADALGALAPFWQKDPFMQFIGALIIRGQRHPNWSASTSYMMSGMEDISGVVNDGCDVSAAFPSFVEDTFTHVVSGDFGPNEFWRFMIDLVHSLNGHDHEYCLPTTLTGGYGARKDGYRCSHLFAS